jgi:hypothetical protein
MNKPTTRIVVIIAATVLVFLASAVAIFWDRLHEWRIEHEVKAAWQARHGEIQQNRALLVSETALKALDRIDIAISVAPEELTKFSGMLIEALGSSEILKSQQVVFSEPQIALSDQQLQLAIKFKKTFSRGTVEGSVLAAGDIGAVDAGLFVNLIARDVVLDHVSIAKGGWANKLAVSAIDEFLQSILGITNVILDKEINRNPDKALVVWLDQKTLINQKLEDQNTATLKFAPKTIETAMIVEASAVLLKTDRLTVAAKVSFDDPSHVPDRKAQLSSKLPLVRELVDIPKAESSRRLHQYQDELSRRLQETFADVFPIANDKSAIAVFTMEAASRAINHALSQTPIHGTGTLDEPSRESTDLTVKIEPRNCMDLINGCEFKQDCDANRCEEKVQKVVQGTCQVSCCLTAGLLGCLIPGLCNRACNAMTTVVQPVVGVHCDAFRAASALTGGALCNIASNLDKATCDVEKNVGKAACDGGQEIGRFYEHNPFAALESTVKPHITIDATIESATVSSDFAHLDVKATLAGRGGVDVGLKYIRKFPSDILLPGTMGFGVCLTNWNEESHVDITAKSTEYSLGFDGALAEDVEAHELVFTYKLNKEQIIWLDFSPPPMVAVFGSHPQLTLNCPSAVAGAFAVGVGEAIFTQADARQVMPLFSGKDYPFHVKDAELPVRIPQLPVCRSLDTNKCAENKINLIPKIRKASIMYVGAD